MSTNFLIHFIIFVIVFVITGIVFSKRAKKKKKKNTGNDYKQIHTENFEAEELLRQAKYERFKAREELKKAENLKKKAEEEWIKILAKMKVSQQEIKNPYDILGVHENDSIERIKEVHLKLIKIYHPDRYEKSNDLSKGQKNKMTSQINAAYDWILKHHKLN